MMQPTTTLAKPPARPIQPTSRADLTPFHTALPPIQDNTLRPQLLRAHERIASLHADNVQLRGQLVRERTLPTPTGARARALPLGDRNPPSGGEEAPAARAEVGCGAERGEVERATVDLSLLQECLIEMEREAAVRGEEHGSCLRGLASAEQARAKMEEAMKTELTWVKTLDEMRLQVAATTCRCSID